MTASLRALLAGAIDYAGLFPPAELPLEQAFANYLRYRQGPDAWILGRFVIPVPRLGELFPPGHPSKSAPPRLSLTALARGGNTTEAFLENLDVDLTELRSFFDRHHEDASAEVLECKLPAYCGPAASTRVALLPRVRDAIINTEINGPEALSVFLEPFGFAQDIFGRFYFVDALDLASEINARCLRKAGAKIRCGGLKADAFPAPAHVAFALDQCARRKVPLKLTAGLHHPLAHFDPTLGVTVHGFINVFVAAAVASCWSPPVEVLVQILSEEEPNSFRFTDRDLHWKDWGVDVEKVRQARQTLLLSFGSCSFDEPREDLRALGWL